MKKLKLSQVPNEQLDAAVEAVKPRGAEIMNDLNQHLLQFLSQSKLGEFWAYCAGMDASAARRSQTYADFIERAAKLVTMGIHIGYELPREKDVLQ